MTGSYQLFVADVRYSPCPSHAGIPPKQVAGRSDGLFSGLKPRSFVENPRVGDCV